MKSIIWKLNSRIKYLTIIIWIDYLNSLTNELS